jgi:hypothetical protein
MRESANIPLVELFEKYIPYLASLPLTPKHISQTHGQLNKEALRICKILII